MRTVYQKENFKIITYLLSVEGPESQCLKHFKIRHYRPKECMPLTFNKFANIYVKLLLIVLDSDQLLSFYTGTRICVSTKRYL